MINYLDIAPCGYFSFTDNGALQEVNSTLCLLLSYSREDLIGNKIDSILTLPSRIFFQTHLFPLLKMQGHAEEIFITLLTKNKTQLPILLNASNQPAQGNNCYTCAFITVHNRKKFEDELITAKKEAERALHENTALQAVKQELQKHAKELDEQLGLVNKINGELRQINRAVSHELQEPLRKISFFTQILKDSPHAGTDPNFNINIERVLRSTARLRAVIFGLQQFMWLQDAPVAYIEINTLSLLKDAVKKLNEEFGPAIMELSIGELPAIWGDQQQLELLFYHALSNCIKFRKEEKAYISITGTIIEKNHFRMIPDKYEYREFLRLDIRDKGMGFDPRYKDQAFELFRRLQVIIESTGIGLALCKKITEKHRGFITIDSRQHEGTTLSIMLPVRHPEKI